MQIEQDIAFKPFSLFFISNVNLGKCFVLNVQFGQQSEKKSIIHTTLFTNTLCGGVDWMTNLVCSHMPPPLAYISAEKLQPRASKVSQVLIGLSYSSSMDYVENVAVLK